MLTCLYHCEVYIPGFKKKFKNNPKIFMEHAVHTIMFIKDIIKYAYLHKNSNQ